MEVVSKVVLLCMPRTGSTMVARQLGTHPKIKFLGSIFGERGWCGFGRHYRYLHDGLTNEWDDPRYRVSHHQQLLDKWFTAAVPGGCAGFKHHLSGAPEVTEAVVDNPSIGTILLTRANFLASYSSDKVTRMKARATQPEGRKPLFDAQEYENFASRRQIAYGHWRPKILDRSGPWIEIDYVEARRQSGMERLVSFLGLDPTQLAAPRTPKRNSDDIVSRFENPEAVLRYLADHGLQHWQKEEEPDESERPQTPQEPKLNWRQAARRRERKAERKAERLRRHQATLETLGLKESRAKNQQS